MSFLSVIYGGYCYGWLGQSPRVAYGLELTFVIMARVVLAVPWLQMTALGLGSCETQPNVVLDSLHSRKKNAGPVIHIKGTKMDTCGPQKSKQDKKLSKPTLTK